MDTVHYHFEMMATQLFPNESDASFTVSSSNIVGVLVS